MRIQDAVMDEVFDVFTVRQLTRASSLESEVAVDEVVIAPRQNSQVHRHNRSDTLLYIVDGSGEVLIEDQVFIAKPGDRFHVAPGKYHGVRTFDLALRFISIQRPPILNKSSQELDLEPRH